MPDANTLVDTLNVVCLQLNSQESFDENFAQIHFLAGQAIEQAPCDIMVLPENFAFLGDVSGSFFQSFSDKRGSVLKVVEDFLQKLALKLDCMILAGGFPAEDKNTADPNNVADGVDPAHGNLNEQHHKFFNRSVVFNRQGKKIAQYDKIHLFDATINDGAVYHESKKFYSGANSPQTFAIQNEFIGGLSICYDLRFAELYRSLVFKGANVLFVPAAFAYKTGEAHWQTLLQARAIENTSYVVAAAQCGQHSQNRRTFGRSMIIDPWGKVIAVAGEEIGFIRATLSLSRLQEVRQQLPCLTHAKLHC